MRIMFPIIFTLLVFGCISVENKSSPGKDAGGDLVCPQNTKIEGDSCVCIEGYEDCDFDWENGCETNKISDPENCGACGLSCGKNSVCIKGLCGCKEGYVNSNGLWGDGCETKVEITDGGFDVSSDTGFTECTDNCSEKCKPNKICKNGYCVDYGICANNNDCPCGWHCNVFEGRCEECVNDDDCKNRTDGKTKCDVGKSFLCIEQIVCNPACDPNCQVCKDGNCVLALNKCCQNSDCPSDKCINYICDEHLCSDKCSNNDECKIWCNDSDFICKNNVCVPPECKSDNECDQQCGYVNCGLCNGGICECKSPCGSGTGKMCNACNDNRDCDTANGFICVEFTNPLSGAKYNGCSHSCTTKTDCEAPAIMCTTAGNTLCTCMSVQ